MMNNISVKVKDLSAGQTFRTERGIYKVVRPYWPQARNPAYRAADIILIECFVPHPFFGMQTGTRVSFNCNTKVQLV